MPIGHAELAFCRKHGIPEERLFDAEGLTPAQRRERMQGEEKWAAYGVVPCGPSSHQLRSRRGTCLMCNPLQVVFILRSKQPGFVYVARSTRGRLTKIGFSNEPLERLKVANYEGWEGYSDWRLVACAWSKMAGRLESDLHHHFAERRANLSWTRNGLATVSREAFSIEAHEAISELTYRCENIPEIVPP